MTERRRTATDVEFRAAVRALDEGAVLIPAPDWHTEARGLELPGLYARWVDEPGAADLSRGGRVT
jgi:hypothetical protein